MSDAEEPDGLRPPDGFEEIPGRVFRRNDELLVVVEGVAFHVRVPPSAEAFGPPPPGFEWTGEVRPPKRGEWFWSELRGQPIEAIKDETGVNQFGEPTGGRKILRPVGGPAPPAAKPARSNFRLIKND